ncbi:MAG TPA: MFS transporter [Acetivibrio sp.]|nr:MFS transporter [Acetivibrio sp.]HQA57919.1 MFS transporter [Acetivibrio sp.]
MEEYVMKEKGLQAQNNTWMKKIALFLASQNVSLFGSSVVSFAIIWYITLETSSGKWVMLSAICSMLPQVLISLWAGVWADRYNRKYLILFSDGFIALSTLILAVIFFAGYRSINLLLVVSFIRSVFTGIQTPAVNAVYPQIVPAEKLTKVNGINQTLNALLLLLAPAVGGMVLGYLDISWAFMIDVITAVIAIIILCFIKIDKVSQPDEKSSVFENLREGVKYTFENKLLKDIIICFGISFFLITPAAFLTPIMIQRSFGDEVWRLTANEMVWTIGSLIGGIFVSFRGEFKNKIRTIAISLIAFGITFALLGMVKWFMVYLLIMGLSGFFMPICSTAQTVLIQENVQDTMMGRVFSIIQIITSASMPVAMLLFGPLADVVSVELILLVTGIMLAGLGFIVSRYRIT